MPQKFYNSFDEKFPSNYKKGGTVKTTGSKGVKMSKKDLVDEKVKAPKAPEAMPEGKMMAKKGGGKVHKAMGGPIGDMKALPEGKVMEKAKGGKMDKRMGKC